LQELRLKAHICRTRTFDFAHLSSLKKLHLAGFFIATIPKLPPTIQEMHLGDCQVNSVGGLFIELELRHLKSLRIVVLPKLPISIVDQLSTTVTELSVKRDDVHCEQNEMPDFSRFVSLRVLKYRSLLPPCASQLPSSVKKLVLEKCDHRPLNSNLSHLTRLCSLSMSDCRVFYWPILPLSITNLSLTRVNLNDIPLDLSLFEAITHVTLVASGIQFVDLKLPPYVEELEVRSNQFSGHPLLDFSTCSKLRRLDLRSCFLLKYPALPTCIEKVDLRLNAFDDKPADYSRLNELRSLHINEGCLLKIPSCDVDPKKWSDWSRHVLPIPDGVKWKRALAGATPLV
jgi:hypothetical protein